jgi:hypothetical protein
MVEHMRYSVRIRHRQVELRGHEVGQSWQVLDRWPITTRSLPERWYERLPAQTAATLENQLTTARIGSYTACPLGHSPATPEDWLQAITHLCWELRSGNHKVSSLVPLAVAHHRLLETLRILGLELPSLRRRGRRRSAA